MFVNMDAKCFISKIWVASLTLLCYMLYMEREKHFMEIALEEALKAEMEGEVPIGAILVKGEEVIAKAHNQVIQRTDPTAHAEILVLRKAALKLKNYRLLDTELYVTIEPCIMCGGAIIQARIKRLVFGALEPKMGAFGSVYDLSKDKRVNHHVEIKGGVLAKEAQALMQRFFKERRGTEVAITGATRNRLAP